MSLLRIDLKSNRIVSTIQLTVDECWSGDLLYDHAKRLFYFEAWTDVYGDVSAIVAVDAVNGSIVAELTTSHLNLSEPLIYDLALL